MMIPKSVLFDAKAFLCWDSFEDLSIQLVPVQNSAAYYYPPDNKYHSLVIFYNDQLADFCEPLFLLFHEAGHVLQWKKYKAEGALFSFYENINLSTGFEKQNFEKQAWEKGRELFVKFSKQQTLSHTLIDEFDAYAKRSVSSYAG